jgi:hypothetical protein
MSDTCIIDIWLAINEDGDCHVTTESAGDALNELVSDVQSVATRVIQISVTMPKPTVTKVNIDVPETDAEPPRITVEA